MVSNTIGALPHRATLVREDKEHLTWLSTYHAPGLSQWAEQNKKEAAEKKHKAAEAKLKEQVDKKVTPCAFRPSIF